VAALETYSWNGSNPGLPESGSGAELQQLLTRLPAWGAVYAFVEGDDSLLGLLSAIDFSSAILARRCIFVPRRDAAHFLHELLGVVPGLLPPGQLIRLAHVAAERIEQLRQTCEEVLRGVQDQRAARVVALRTAPVSPAGNSLRLAIVAPAGQAVSPQTLAELSAAATAAGWPCLVSATDGPGAVHPLAHLERLAIFRPSVTLCTGPADSWCDITGGRTLHWCQHVDDAAVRDPSRVYLAASPAIHSALQQAGVAASRIHDFYWGVDPAAAGVGPTESANSNAGAVWVLCPDRKSPPEPGLDQPMLRRLWEEMRRATADDWRNVAADATLAAAERRLGVSVRDATVRGAMLDAVERALIPASMTERIEQTLWDEGLRALKGNARWELHSDSVTVTGPARAGQIDRTTRPLAVVAPWSGDPLSADLLRAVMESIPVLMFSTSGVEATRLLGGVLRPDAHLTLFASQRDLRDLLRRLRRGDTRFASQAAAARAHLVARHTWSHRLLALGQVLGHQGVAATN
jgi:hypothetical protein